MDFVFRLLIILPFVLCQPNEKFKYIEKDEYVEVEEDVFSIIPEKLLTCTADRCAGVKYDIVEELFKGKFHTKSEIDKFIDDINKANRGPGKAGEDIQPDNDWDVCCPTRYSNKYTTQLKNINGTMRTLVHMPNRTPEPLYQAIPEGNCAPGGACKNCQQQQSVHFLLVIDPYANSYPPLKFDQFLVNSYCSCKSM